MELEVLRVYSDKIVAGSNLAKLTAHMVKSTGLDSSRVRMAQWVKRGFVRERSRTGHRLRAD